MVNETIINKVKALLNMTESNGCTEAEAGLAMERVQSMLLKHNLDMSTITNDSPAAPVGIGVIDGNEEHGFNWKNHLLGVIARNSLCKVIGSPHMKQWHLFGSHDNVKAVLEMYHWIVPELERLALSAWKEYKANNGYENARTWKQGFFVGAASTIHKRLAESLETFSAGVGHALVLYNQQALSTAVHKVYPHLTSSRISQGGYGGRDAGIVAGNGVHLRPQRSLSSGALRLR